MNYAVELGSGSMINIPSFIKISEIVRGNKHTDTQTHRQQGDLISYFYFFEIRKVC
jgi:hypothetical protein